MAQTFIIDSGVHWKQGAKRLKQDDCQYVKSEVL